MSTSDTEDRPLLSSPSSSSYHSVDETPSAGSAQVFHYPGSLCGAGYREGDEEVRAEAQLPPPGEDGGDGEDGRNGEDGGDGGNGEDGGGGEGGGNGEDGGDGEDGRAEPAGNEHDADSVCKDFTHFIFRGLFIIFYFLCSLTGQLMVRSECFDHESRELKPIFRVIVKSWIFVSSTLFLLIFGIANLLSFIFDMVVIIWCPFKYCGYIYINTNETNVTNQTENTILVGVPLPEKINQYDDWQKTVFTTATISGLLSYYFIVILVLCPLYGTCNPCSRRLCDCVADIWTRCGEKDAQSSANNEELLNPFVDSNDSPHSTSLRPRQSFYFHLIFWMNLFIFIAGVVVFFIILADRIYSKDHFREVFDIAGLAAQFGSQFCAILSCFIFSKVAYAVSSKCLWMEELFDRVNQKAGVPQWDEFLTEMETCHTHYIKQQDRRTIARSDTPHLTTLKMLDKWYVRRLKGSLDPYGTWFAVHWVLYTISAFMSVAYFAETVLEDLYGYTKSECHSTNNLMCKLDLAYIGLFMLEHCILFLYPCFRAASVTAARYSLIKRVSKAEWNHIPPLEKESFCTYLNNHNCSFEISILCAKLPFGFNLAYVSIFFGVFGVILKLSI